MDSEIHINMNEINKGKTKTEFIKLKKLRQKKVGLT